MTANLLTLNSSKTEFLLIGLSKQLAKINSLPPLTLLETSARPVDVLQSLVVHAAAAQNSDDV